MEKNIWTDLVSEIRAQLIPPGQVGEQESSSATSVFIPGDFHTRKNVFGSTPHAFKNPSETVKQMLSIWQPLCDCGEVRTKASAFHRTAALLQICLELFVRAFKVLKLSLHAPVASEERCCRMIHGRKCPVSGEMVRELVENDQLH